MAIYIVQGRYSQSAIAGMINKAEDRGEAVAALAKAVGGKMLDYFVTFGPHDFLVVIDGGRGKKETDVMAALMTAAAGGGVTDLTTTVGVRSKDAMKAMRSAKRIVKGFQSAGVGE